MQIESKSAESLVLEIEKLLSQGGYQEAVKLCQAINEHHPNLGHGWFLSSCVAYQLNIMPFALHSVNQALSLSIDNPNLKIQKAKCLVKMGDMAQALEIIDNLVKHKMLNAELFNDIALIYNDCHQLNKACEIFKMAIELSPESSNYYYNLASVERYLGLIESCESNCNLAIKNDLFNFDAHYLRSNLKKQSLESNHTEQLNKVLETEIGHPVNYAKIKYALAKELEDCGKFRKSFEARQEGASAYRKLFNYNVKADVEFMQNIALTYNQDVFKKEIQGDLGAGLIFILGLPRTGSTLVERIMSNHSAISSMGELSAFSNIMSEMVSHLASTKAASVSDMVNLSSQLNFQKLGQSYMDYISRIKIDSKYHIDKFPQNSLYIGLIHLALPQAKIILVERDPMDSCYSIYKELFTNIYHYSFD